MKITNKTVALALAVWGVGVVGGFWQYEGRYLRPVGRPAGAASYELNGSALPVAPLSTLQTDRGKIVLRGVGPVTLINFWSPTCACSRFAEPQVRALYETYAGRGVRLITVVQSDGGEREQAEALREWYGRGMPGMPVALDPKGRIARMFGVWAAPAAVILNRQGHIAYLGAYNAARFCADPATAWAMQALQAIQAGKPVLHATTPFYGCQMSAASR